MFCFVDVLSIHIQSDAIISASHDGYVFVLMIYQALVTQ